MSGTPPPAALAAIERPERVRELLATWAAAFEEVKMAARDKPRLRPEAEGKSGHILWGARVSGIEVDISIEVVTDNLRWRLDHNSQGALATLEGRPVLLRQWYVKRAPQDASLSAAEIAQVTEESPFYVRPSISRGKPTERRLYQLLADLSAPAAAIRQQTAAGVALHKAASAKFGLS
ncbi:hypothetical protein [Falsiroseomonas sp. CW058]|uniref:hypothetical protein n=1 Tax=Falsiroseomonas sp. CW058 TaxID=3388664 RepID=UPI003D315891